MTRWNFSSAGNEVVSAFSERVKNKTILITGPSPSSIGAETALSLAHASPSTIFLTGRELSKLAPVIEEIKAISPTTNVNFIPLDLSFQSSVRNAVKQIEELLGAEGKIDILVHCAGIMVTPYERIEGWGGKGVEGQFATNYLGGWLLVNLLLPRVLRRGEDGKEGGRVVLVSSSAHAMGGVRFGDLGFEDGKVYNEWLAYAQSKTALILFASSLARKFSRRNLYAYSLHPGSIKSNLQTNMLAKPELLDEGLRRAKEAEEKEGRVFVRGAVKTLQQGCATSLVAALDPEVEEWNGAYLDDGDVAGWVLPGFATGLEEQERLWGLSEELVGEKFDW